MLGNNFASLALWFNLYYFFGLGRVLFISHRVAALSQREAARMVPLLQPIILSVRNLRLSTSSPQFGRRVAARAMRATN